jgi:hypothetical protein
MVCISPAGYVRRWDWFSEMAEMDSEDFTIYPLVNHGKTMGKWPFIVSFPIKNCDFP